MGVASFSRGASLMVGPSCGRSRRPAPVGDDTLRQPLSRRQNWLAPLGCIVSVRADYSHSTVIPTRRHVHLFGIGRVPGWLVFWSLGHVRDACDGWSAILKCYGRSRVVIGLRDKQQDMAIRSSFPASLARRTRANRYGLGGCHRLPATIGYERTTLRIDVGKSNGHAAYGGESATSAPCRSCQRTTARGLASGARPRTRSLRPSPGGPLPGQMQPVHRRRHCRVESAGRPGSPRGRCRR